MARSWGAVVTLVLLCCLFVFVASGAGPVEREHDAATDSYQTDAGSGEGPTFTDGPPTAALGSVEIDRTLFAFTVRSDGDAEWLFEFQIQLQNDEEIRNFEQFAEFFRTNETELYRDFQDRAYTLVRSANRTTDRDMRARSFSRNAAVEKQLGGDVGVLQIRFEWSNFAQVDDDGVVRVGDVFTGQLFIDASQRLRIVAGDGLRFEAVQPQGDVRNREQLSKSTRVTWEGQREFADGRPRAVLVPVGYEGPVGGSDEQDSSGSGVQPGVAIGGLFLLALVVTGVVLWRRDQLPIGETPSQQTGEVADATTPPMDHRAGTTQEASSATADPTHDADGSTGADIPDEELLSDEDRVVAMIEERGGRMKQVDIVEETGWSKSKVSMLLSDMEEEDRISKIRVGRENIIALEGHEPDAASSPFEDA